MGQKVTSGVGMEGAMGAAAVTQIRDEIIRRAQAQQDMELKARDMALRESEAQQRTQYQNAQLAQLAEERAANAEGRRVTAGTQLSNDLSIGDTLQPDQSSVLRAAHMGSNIDVQSPAVASTQYQGVVQMPRLMGRMIQPSGAASEEQGQPSQGIASVTQAEGHGARDVYRGTSAQRKTDQQQKIIASNLRMMDPNSPAAQWLGLEYATGKSVPAGVIAPHAGDANYSLPGVGPIVGVKSAAGRITYQGRDVTDQVKPYVAPPTQNSTDTRVDRSYQYHRTALDKLAKPLEDQQQRMGRLIESVNQGTPQADALVAPELLTVMAGGQGSGLRMNEAEISRIIGGRSKWESLKATLNQWATDPSRANSIPPDQRVQIRQLIQAVHEKSQAALGALNDAGDQLLDADVMGHRRILADTRKKLQHIYDTPGQGGPTNPAQAPIAVPYGGKTYTFPNQAAADSFKREAGIR